MASEHRIIRVNDKDPRRTRRKRYRRVYKGDVLRVSRATEKSANQVVQEFGLNRDVRIMKNDCEELVIDVRRGTNKLLPPQQGGGRTGTGSSQPPIDGGPIEEVLGRFPNPLTELEIECISTFVQNELRS